MHSVELIKIAGQNVYKLTLDGFIQIEEMQDFQRQCEEAPKTPAPNFRVFGDIRGFKPATPNVQEIMVQIQEGFKVKGLKKVAVLVENVVTKIQMQRLHSASGVKGTDQFFAGEEDGYMEKIEQFLGE